MKHQPGISWGSEAPINLIKSSKGYLAVFYGEGIREIIKIFKPNCVYDWHQVLDQMALWNYGTCELCPMVKLEMDWTS